MKILVIILLNLRFSYELNGFNAKIYEKRININNLNNKIIFYGYTRSKLDCITEILKQDNSQPKYIIIYRFFYCFYSNSTSNLLYEDENDQFSKYHIIKFKNFNKIDFDEITTQSQYNKLYSTSSTSFSHSSPLATTLLLTNPPETTTFESTTASTQNILKETTWSNMKYVIIDEQLSYQDAIDWCFYYNFEPFKLDITPFFFHVMMSSLLVENIEVWIFIDDEAQEGTLKWAKDGSTVSSELQDNLNGKIVNVADTDCIIAQKQYSNKFYSIDCSLEKRFICQKTV